MQPNIIRAPDFALQYESQLHTLNQAHRPLSRRRQQIESLKASFATIVEVIRDTLLDVPLVLRDRKTITLRVYGFLLISFKYFQK
jgi:hypothetical protein